MPIMAAVKATQATANHEPNIARRKKRRSVPFLAGAGGFGGAAFGGAGGVAVAVVVPGDGLAVTAVDGGGFGGMDALGGVGSAIFQ